MYIDRTDPEKPKLLAHIWRLCHTSVYLNQEYKDIYGTGQTMIDCGYCLDRYSLIDAPKENYETTS